MKKVIFLLALSLCIVQAKAQTSLKTINFLTPNEYNNLTFATFSPNDEYILIGGDDGVIAKFNLTDKKPLLKKGIDADRKDIYSAKYTPDGKYILAGGLSGVLYLLSPNDLSVIKTIPKFGKIELITISPDSKSAFIDDRIVDIESFAVTVKNLRTNDYSRGLFTADGKRLYRVDGYELIVTNPANGKDEKVVSLGRDVRDITLSPNGKYLVAGFQESATTDTLIKVVNTETWQVKDFVRKTGSGDYSSVFSFLPDNKSVLYHTQTSGNIFKLNAETGEVSKLGGGRHILSLSNNARYIVMLDMYDSKIEFSELN
jgi:WD40 repeat protein